MRRAASVLVILLVAVSGGCGPDTPAEQPFNVLFIGIDDLRPTLGSYGDGRAVTPHLDALSRTGTVFLRAYAQQAVCNPSRASLLTGRRPDTIRVWDLKAHYRSALPGVVTLPQHFRENGYLTRSVGKIHHNQPPMFDPPSWSAPEELLNVPKRDEYVLPENRTGPPLQKAASTEIADVEDAAYVDGQVTGRALVLLEELRDQRFFLAVGFKRPHLPFSAPRRYWDLYDPALLELPQEDAFPAGAPQLALHNSEELRGYRDVPDSGPFPEELTRRLVHGYYASVTYIDAQIGVLLERLQELGLKDKTIVVVWSDHGYHLGEQGLWAKKTNFELDTRTPLIVSIPGRGRGVQTRALVELVDLYPTLVEASGLSLPEGLEGVSLLPLLENPEQPWKSAVFSQYPRGFESDRPVVMGYSIRNHRYRYTEWRRFGSDEILARELYDHSESWTSGQNLVDFPAGRAVAERLQGQLAAGWRTALPPHAADH